MKGPAPPAQTPRRCLEFRAAQVAAAGRAGLGQDRAVSRFDGDQDDGVADNVFQIARDSGDRAPGADARDQDIDHAAGILPDFRACGAFVDGGV